MMTGVLYQPSLEERNNKNPHTCGFLLFLACFMYLCYNIFGLKKPFLFTILEGIYFVVHPAAHPSTQECRPDQSLAQETGLWHEARQKAWPTCQKERPV